jgi:hypothetical protein
MKLILDVSHTRTRFRNVFGTSFGEAIGHRALEGDFAIVNLNRNFARVDICVLREHLINVFSDPFVGPPVPFRTATRK